MKNRRIQLEQLDAKILSFNNLGKITVPPEGWIKAIRLAIGMTQSQLGKRLGITTQSVMEMEQREISGSITLNGLQEAAKKMNLQLVYGLIPPEGSLDAMVEKKAKKLAEQIVFRTSANMKLEDQENREQRIKKAIEERTYELKKEMPKLLWN